MNDPISLARQTDAKQKIKAASLPLNSDEPTAGKRPEAERSGPRGAAPRNNAPRQSGPTPAGGAMAAAFAKLRK